MWLSFYVILNDLSDLGLYWVNVQAISILK